MILGKYLFVKNDKIDKYPQSYVTIPAAKESNDT